MGNTLEQAMLESELALADETLITPVNEYLLIDPETRLIEVPESESLFGVYSENGVEVKHFACPKIVLNNIDLSQMYIYINYVSASGRYGQTLAKNIKTSEDGNYITFDWELTGNVFDLNTNGKIYFAVMAKKQMEDKNPVFATRKASGDYYETIEAGEVIQEQYADIILEMLTRIEALENGGTGGSSFSGKASDVTYDDTETKLGADNVQDAISKVSEEIGDLKDDVTNVTVGTFIDYDQNVKAVNHRGFSTTAPENTIPAYILSKQKGFKYAECDVSFTSDGVAVLLHDATIDRTSDGSGNINNLTYAEVLQYDFGSWKNSKYAGTKIPTFEEFIMTCKAIGLHPYIELKSSGSYTQEQITGIVDVVKACGMEGKVTYISFNATFLEYVKTADTKARLGYLANITDATIATANGLKTEENEVFMDVSYSNVTDEKVALCIANNLPLEIWTVNNASVIENMDKYVSGVTSDNLIAGKILYDKYMIYIPPESEDVPATGITLNKTALTFEDSTTQTLVATLEPTYSTDEVIWSSSNNGVATVADGVVTPIAKGNCTITATAGSVSANCEITVNVEEIVTYTITRNLTNCTSNSSVTSINEGSAHTETITADSGYTLNDAEVSITMGGVDISSKYSGGVLNIENVIGDIIITIESAILQLTSGWVDDKITLTSNDFIHGTINNKYPYTKNEEARNRLSYIGTAVTIEQGYTYHVSIDCSDNITRLGVQQIDGHDEFVNQETVTKYDSNWQLDGYEFEATNENVEFAWITLASGLSATVVYLSDINSVTITRWKTDEKVYKYEGEEGELLFNWNLTDSLLDTVQGKPAKLNGSVSDGSTTIKHGENGVSILSQKNGIYFNYLHLVNKTIEVDIASMTGEFSSHNGRLLCIGATDQTGNYLGSGLVWRSTSSGWSTYLTGGWESSVFSTDPMLFSGKTLKVKIKEDLTFNIYIDDELIYTATKIVTITDYGNMSIGSENTSVEGTVITGVRIYQGTA